MDNYYVYAYLREDGTPYYIGKGKNKRMYIDKGRPVKKPKNEDNIILLESKLDEETAFEKEKYYISLFGRKDIGTGILRNKTNGGEGSSGVIFPEEYKENMSKIIKNLYSSGKITAFWKNKTQTDDHKKKNSESNSGKNKPMFGRKHKKISKELISKKKEKYQYEIENIYTGIIVITTNLKKFCLEYNLSKTGLQKTFLRKSKSGKKYTQHKGYKINKKVEINAPN